MTDDRCPEQKDLQRFADGELKEPKRCSVAEHVSNCEQCARELQQLQRVGALVSVAIRKETERHDLAGLWERVRVGMTTPARKDRAWEVIFGVLWRRAARVAYAALVVLVAGFFAFKTLFPGGERPQARSSSSQAPGITAVVGQARVDGVSSYNPEVTVSVLLAYGDKSAIVCISGLESVEEN